MEKSKLLNMAIVMEGHGKTLKDMLKHPNDYSITPEEHVATFLMTMMHIAKPNPFKDDPTVIELIKKMFGERK